jgi:GTP-binding protein HflX
VKQTLAEIDATGKPTIMLFNKIDAYSFIEKEPDDLTPATKENLTLGDLKKTWLAKDHNPTLFISATKRKT